MYRFQLFSVTMNDMSLATPLKKYAEKKMSGITNNFVLKGWFTSTESDIFQHLL